MSMNRHIWAIGATTLYTDMSKIGHTWTEGKTGQKAKQVIHVLRAWQVMHRMGANQTIHVQRAGQVKQENNMLYMDKQENRR